MTHLVIGLKRNRHSADNANMVLTIRGWKGEMIIYYYHSKCLVIFHVLSLPVADSRLVIVDKQSEIANVRNYHNRVIYKHKVILVNVLIPSISLYVNRKRIL